MCKSKFFSCNTILEGTENHLYTSKRINLIIAGKLTKKMKQWFHQKKMENVL